MNLEAKMKQIKPKTLGQASRIPGCNTSRHFDLNCIFN